MTDLPALDVVLGLSFVYFILSLVCSSLNEAIAGVFKLRAKDLKRGIANLLDDLTDGKNPGPLTEKLYSHPLIRTLYRGDYNKGRLPSYIPASAFASALIDKLRLLEVVKKADPEERGREIKGELEKLLGDSLPAGDRASAAERVSETIEALLNQAENDLDKLRLTVETWFDGSMDRVSGWYKRRAQIILLALGIVLAGCINADTLQITDRLWSDDTVRAAVVAQAEKTVETNGAIADVCTKRGPSATPPEADARGLDDAAECISELEALKFPLFWDDAVDRPDDGLGWLKKGTGLLLTAVALTLGAPFWFDLLGRLVNVRAAGVEPKKAEHERRDE